MAMSTQTNFNAEAFMDRIKGIMDKNPNIKDTNEALSELVAEMYNPVPWSNITPRIQDTEQANGGVGVALYTIVNKEVMCLMVVPHNSTETDPKYQIPGGFIDFSKKETLTEGCVREVAEEMRLPRPIGALFKNIDTQRFFPLDNLFLYINDQARYLNSFGMALTKLEIDGILEKTHGATEADFLAATKNEIKGLAIVPLKEILAKPEILGHADQLSLFKKLEQSIFPPKRQTLKQLSDNPKIR